jgi:hypothetical protein
MLTFSVGKTARRTRRRVVLGTILVTGAFAAAATAQPQLDICGCKNHPASLGDFDTAVPSTYPPGTTSDGASTMTIPLPPDGILVFNSVFLRQLVGYAQLTINFVRNPANTPVTILVSGDASITGSVSGAPGVAASTGTLGNGGLGGPGGFRGGDGAYQIVNFATLGGTGLGPGGGAGGSSSYFAGGHGAGGAFVGVADLLPLVGGAGGGGGASTAPNSGCAILIAVNGVMTLNGQIIADGGNYGSQATASCSSAGGGGSGGAIRLLARTIVGSGNLYARGGSGINVSGGVGSIRMEALSNELPVNATTPIATRAPGPGPVVHPITPTVAITTIGNQAIPTPPQGVFGTVDLVLPVPGPTTINLATSGVPGGTTVNVTVKPRVGGPPVIGTATLSTCDPEGSCLASVTVNLEAGSYFVEARATFETAP